MAVLCAVWKRHFALLCTVLPGLFAPILTIITGGLYTVVPVPWTYNTELQVEGWFHPENCLLNATTNDERGNDKAWTIFTLNQFSNMSYPEWTQGQYSLSSFGADNLCSYDGNNTSLLMTAYIPATRANLNCSLIGHYAEDDYQTIEADNTHSCLQWLPVDPRPLGCDTPPEWNHTTGHRSLYLRSLYITNEDGTESASQGYYLAALHDNYDSLVSVRYNQSIDSTTSVNVCGDRRQHYFIGLGDGPEALSLLHCVPYVEALWVTATFSLPDLSLVTDMPIVPDTDSSVILSASASMTAIPFFNWGQFFSAIVNGSSGVGQLKGLMPGPEDNHAREFIAAVEMPLAEYLAQRLHFMYRQPLDDIDKYNTSTSGYDLFNPGGQPATGTVTDGSRLRLIQNEVSTRVLQGLLGAMVLCLVAETIMVRGGRVIPRDPGSIASRMAYFAGGELWRHVPVGADRWSDEEIIKWGRENCKGGLLLDWWESDEREASEDEAPQPSERARRFAVDSVNRKGVVSGHRIRQDAAEPLEA